MRTIKWSTDFKKDYRRIKATPRYAQELDGLLGDVIDLLIKDEPFPKSTGIMTWSATGTAIGNATLNPTCS